MRITSPPRLVPPGPWQKPIRRSKDECLSCVWEVWFRRWERAAKVTWKEENSVHLSLWLGMQGWRDQQGSALQASLEPGKHYWITRASISCRTTFLNSGLQCHLRTAPCVLFPSYGVSFTKSKLSHTFRLFSGNLIWCLIPLFHSQIITSSPSFYQKIPAPWKLILSNQSSLPYPLTTSHPVSTSAPGSLSFSPSQIQLSMHKSLSQDILSFKDFSSTPPWHLFQ